MTKLKEEKDLQAITEEYSKAIEAYQKKNQKKAQELFAKIIKEYENSEFYSVMEIQARSKVYFNIIQSQLHPIKIELKTREDQMWEGVFQLNKGNFDAAIELLQKSQSHESNPQVMFLLAIAHYHKEEMPKTLEYLEKCIKLDNFYKIIAFNEPDFEPLRENPDFLALLE